MDFKSFLKDKGDALKKRRLEIVEDLTRNPNDPRYEFITPQNAKSKVWKNFEVVRFENKDEKIARCKLCGYLLRYSPRSGTGSLLRHTCGRRIKDVKQERTSSNDDLRILDAKPAVEFVEIPATQSSESDNYDAVLYSEHSDQSDKETEKTDDKTAKLHNFVKRHYSSNENGQTLCNNAMYREQKLQLEREKIALQREQLKVSKELRSEFSKMNQNLTEFMRRFEPLLNAHAYS